MDCKVWGLTSSSVTLKWSTPVGVASANLSYRLLLSGPAPQALVDEVVVGVSTDPQMWTSSSGLSAETSYTVSIGTIDSTVWGPVTFCTTFWTPSAPLSSPSNQSVLWRVNGDVSVFWKAPPITNGTVKVYQILWDHTPYVACDNSSMGVSTNTTALQYSFPASNSSSSLLVCIRGYNTQLKGAWAWLRATPLAATATTPTPSSQRTSLLKDTGLLVGVVLAFASMLSAATMTVLLACLCWHHKPSSDWKTSNDIAY